MEQESELVERIDKLREKYSSMGQDMLSYVDGLLYADYLTYWDYIRLDVLLNLQAPKTPLPDENIFIMYHQITELYFKLVLHAIDQIHEAEELTVAHFSEQVRRMNSYFSALVKSFEIMIEGMDRDQFLKFRMALLPASGFQSAQYRKIEICSTLMQNLVDYKSKQKLKGYETIEELYDILYWKKGATELATGKKTLTLRQFEKKYSTEFIQLAQEYRKTNLNALLRDIEPEEEGYDELVQRLKLFDSYVNEQWPLMHYKSAVSYLQRKPADINATGGTNWQKYLPPRSQRIMFFPHLWTEEDHNNWGVKVFEPELA